MMTKCLNVLKIMFILCIGIILASCNETKYSLVFDLNGGSINGLEEYEISISEKEENKSVEILIPKKTGYEFVGWYLDGDLYEDEKIIVDHDIVLVAKWEIITYQIGYLLNGGKVESKVESYTCEDEIELPIPVKQGYKFLGWNGTLTKIEKGTTGDLMLKAVWEIEKFNVSYELNGGKLENPINEFTFEDEIELQTPIREGYIFKGWFTNPELSGENVKKISKGTLKNVILYAGWIDASNCYDIKYELDGGILPDDVLYNYEIGYEYTLPIPFKDNCIFIGWYDNVELTGNKINLIEKGDVGDKTYYASWIELESIFNDLVPEKITSNLNLYKVHPDNNLISITWNSLTPNLIDDEGYITPAHTTLTAKLEMIVSYEGVVGRYVGEVEVAPVVFDELTLGNTLVGYVYSGTYSRWGSSNFENVFSDTAIKTLDVVNYGFATINVNGDLTIENTGFTKYLSEVLKLRKYGVRVLLCIGENSKRFSDMASTDEGIDKFVSQVIEIIEKYHFDGVDIDWEFPGVNTGRDVTIDRPNFTKLIKALRIGLDKSQEKGGTPYLLTAAIPGTSWGSARYEMNILDEYLDYVNMMSYDLNNTEIACHHSSLYTSTTARAYGFSIEYGVNQFETLGFNRNKIVVGMAFYGKYYINASELGKSARFSKNIHYTTIKKDYLSNSDFVEYWDETAKAPYLLNEKTGEYISFDSVRSIKEKCRYSKASGIMGVMFWDYSEDTTGDLMNAIYEEMVKK